MACFRLVTFFPLLPDFSLPRLNSRISRSTVCWAFGPYLRVPLLRELLDLDFFVVAMCLPPFLYETLRNRLKVVRPPGELQQPQPVPWLVP